MAAADFFRPRGDITTVIDLVSRDAQDNTYFPVDIEESWFHRSNTVETVYPTTASVQEFTQRGPADWGQKLSFELGSLYAGDLLHSVMCQIRLGSWYDENTLSQISQANYTIDNQDRNQYWTYANSLGTSIIEYADFIVKDQTIERLTGEFIRTFLNLDSDINSLIGISSDAVGSVPYTYLSKPYVDSTPFTPIRPYPTENGVIFCLLPFFFLRTPLKQSFPLLSCNEGTVRIDIKLRPFTDLVRRYIGYRQNCNATPLNSTVTFTTNQQPVSVKTAVCPPAFRDFRMITNCSYTIGSIREKFLHQPFEQMVKLVQIFNFEEPLKYIVSKPNANADTIHIQLPLELNHPVVEVLWVFRRKAVLINNEWSNFTPAVGYETNPTKVYPPWLTYATIRINGSEVVSADGDWFRENIASKHRGGLNSYHSYVYGYSFSLYPDIHQPSGSGNLSRATSMTINMTVNVPIAKDITTLASPSCTFDPVDIGGWEVFVYAIHYNWLRFENGICNPMFNS